MLPWYVIAGLAVYCVAVIVINILTFKELSKIIKNKIEKNRKNAKVFFGKTDKITSFDSSEDIKTKSEELKKEEQNGTISEEEWNNFVKESNFLSVEYDAENDEIIDVGRYSVKKVDAQVQKRLDDDNGIIIVSA